MIKTIKTSTIPILRWTSLAMSAVFYSLFLLIVGCNKSPVSNEAFGIPGGLFESPTLTMSIVSGNFQSYSIGSAFPDPLKVQLLSSGVPVQNKSISFSISSGPSANLSAASATTDAFGMAQITATAGLIAGNVVVRASYLSQTVDFSLEIINQSNAVISLISGNAQTGAIGTALNQPLTVEVLDATSLLPLSNILIRFAVTTGNGRINSSSSLVTVSSDALGRASVNFNLGTLNGANTVTATIVSVPAQSVTFSATGTVPAGSVVDLAQSSVTSASSNLTADGSQTTLLSLATRDIYGNLIPIGGKTITFSVNTGTLQGSVNDLGNGVYTQIVRSPTTTIPAQMIVSGEVNASALTSPQAIINLLAGNISTTQSTITSGANSILANGVATTFVTVTLKDSLGNPLTTGGQNVVFSTTLGTLIGTVNDVGNGTYSQSIQSSTITGSAIVSATVGGALLSNTKAITFTPGAPDATKSLIIASPGTLAPDGNSSSVITVQLRDANNNLTPTASGRTITLTKNNGTWFGSVLSTINASDNGDGTYSGTLISSTTPGNATITATDNGTALTRNTKVFFTNGNNGPSVATSTIAASSSLLAANGVVSTVITVTLKDTYGLQLGSGGSSVVISSSAGTMLGSVIDNGNGTYTQTLRAPVSAAIATISATVDSNAISRTTNVSFYGPISLAQSTLTSSPTSILANGVATTVLYLNAKDSNGVSIPVGGEADLSFNSTFGTLLGSITDNSNGTYSQQLQSTSSPNIAVVSATKSANFFSNTLSVEFYATSNRAGLTIDCLNINTYKNTTLYVNNGTLTMNTRGPNGYCPSDFIFTGLVLQNNAVVTHAATTITQEYALEFSAGYVTIDASSKIDVTGKGYSESTTPGRLRTYGNLPIDSGFNGVGGSHAGVAVNSGAATNLTYGSIFEPNSLGSSGCYYGPGYPTGAGGGKLKLTVTGPAGIELAGSIQADGQNPPNTNDVSNGGSGGSIWIITTKLSSSGTISANGGSRDSTNALHTGAGGGGRVAVYYPTTSDMSGNFSYPLNFMLNVSALGGEAVGNCRAGAGTVFFKSASQNFGDLMIDNKGATTCSGSSTVITPPAIGVNEAVSSNSLTKTNMFVDNYSTTTPYLNWFIDPNINQNATAKKADNSLFKITTATANTITTSGGDMTTVASIGHSAELVLVLDSFEQGNKTTLSTGNTRILVYQGDLRSNDLVSVSYADVLPPKGIEYSGLQSYIVNLNTRTLPAFLVEDFGTADFSISNGTFNFGTLSLRNFLSTTMILTGTKIRASGSLTLSATTAVMTQTVGNYALHVNGAIDITNASTITQANTTASVEYSLEILAGSFLLSSNSSLNAMAKGYTSTWGNNFRVFGNQITTIAYNGSTSVASGGTHGGRGGNVNNTHYSAEVWGNFKNPYTSGGSSGWGHAGNGGGIIRINTGTGSATINGTIDVRGTSNNYAAAGGSIYVSCGLFTGAGSLDATGGIGNSASGGGGRVAVIYSSLGGNFTYPTNALANIKTYGGVYIPSSAANGAPGTLFMKSSTETYGKLIINNNSQILTDIVGRRTVFNLPTISPSTGLSYNALTNRSTLTLANAFAETYGSSDAFVGMFLNPNIAQNATQTVKDDIMYEISNQNANSLSLVGNATGIAGGGNTFQVNLCLDELKVVGNSILEINNGVILTNSLDITNGQVLGTGWVETTSTNNLVVNANSGTVRLNNFAANHLTLQNGSFAFPNNTIINLPGNLILSSAIISGTGHSIMAGGNVSMSSSNIAAASINATGFISLLSSTATVAGSVSTNDDLTLTSSAMTVGNNITTGDDLLVDTSSTLSQSNGYALGVTGDMTVSNNSQASANTINVGAGLTLDTNSTLTTGNRILTPFTTFNTVSHLNVTGDVFILNGSTLTSPATTPTEEYYLYLSAPNLTLSAGSWISVDGKGYRNLTASNFRSIGNADALGFNGSSLTTNAAAGAAYGGRAGTAGSHYSNKSYGSYKLPLYLGTSSSCWGGGCSDTGGGAIRLNIANTLTLNGTISANALAPTSNSSGSGGSVYIDTQTLSGSGIIRANGPQSGTPAYGNGGGGRVAVYYTALSGGFASVGTQISNIQAFGGTQTSTTTRGAAGTVYLKGSSQTYGDLIINNNGQDSSYVTEFPVPSTTASTTLTTNSLSSGTGFNSFYGTLNNFFIGLFLNPNIAQNATNKLSDDILYMINSSTNFTLTTSASGMTSTATTGDSFRLHAIFDNLQVVNKGKLNFAGQNISVLSGDLSSNDTTSFVQDGMITANALDVGPSVNWSTTANASGTVTVKCSSNFSCP